MDYGIDLSFLTEHEQELIREVLVRDEEIQKREEARIKRLKHKAAKTNNPIIHKKIKMRTGEWFWDITEKHTGLKRSRTACDTVRASLRVYKSKPETRYSKQSLPPPLIEVSVPDENTYAQPTSKAMKIEKRYDYSSSSSDNEQYQHQRSHSENVPEKHEETSIILSNGITINPNKSDHMVDKNYEHIYEKQPLQYPYNLQKEYEKQSESSEIEEELQDEYSGFKLMSRKENQKSSSSSDEEINHSKSLEESQLSTYISVSNEDISMKKEKAVKSSPEKSNQLYVTTHYKQEEDIDSFEKHNKSIYFGDENINSNDQYASQLAENVLHQSIDEKPKSPEHNFQITGITKIKGEFKIDDDKSIPYNVLQDNEILLDDENISKKDMSGLDISETDNFKFVIDSADHFNRSKFVVPLDDNSLGNTVATINEIKVGKSGSNFSNNDHELFHSIGVESFPKDDVILLEVESISKNNAPETGNSKPNKFSYNDRIDHFNKMQSVLLFDDVGAMSKNKSDSTSDSTDNKLIHAIGAESFLKNNETFLMVENISKNNMSKSNNSEIDTPNSKNLDKVDSITIQQSSIPSVDNAYSNVARNKNKFDSKNSNDEMFNEKLCAFELIESVTSLGDEETVVEPVADSPLIYEHSVNRYDTDSDDLTKSTDDKVISFGNEKTVVEAVADSPLIYEHNVDRYDTDSDNLTGSTDDKVTSLGNEKTVVEPVADSPLIYEHDVDRYDTDSDNLTGSTDDKVAVISDNANKIKINKLDFFSSNDDEPHHTIDSTGMHELVESIKPTDGNPAASSTSSQNIPKNSGSTNFSNVELHHAIVVGLDEDKETSLVIYESSNAEIENDNIVEKQSDFEPSNIAINESMANFQEVVLQNIAEEEAKPVKSNSNNNEIESNIDFKMTGNYEDLTKSRNVELKIENVSKKSETAGLSTKEVNIIIEPAYSSDVNQKQASASVTSTAYHTNAQQSEENIEKKLDSSDAVGELSRSVNFLSTLENRTEKESPKHDSLGRSTPNLLASKSRLSFGSSWSVQSTSAAIKGDFDITGTITLSLAYANKTGTFNVYVVSCKDLAAAEKKKLSNPYVKTYLLPDKHSKRKTKAKKKTLDPTYNETLKYVISESELRTRTLNVAVWHDKLGTNVFLGEINVDMATFDFYSSRKMITRQLQPKDEDASHDAFDRFYGEVSVAIKLTPNKNLPDDGQLEIVMKNVQDILTKRDSSADIYVKCYLLPDKARSTKQKTPTISGKDRIDFDHLFTYTNVHTGELEHRCIELTVWEHGRFSSNQPIGGVRIGSGTGMSFDNPVPWMDSTEEECTLWRKMVMHPGHWVEGQLSLRHFESAK